MAINGNTVPDRFTGGAFHANGEPFFHEGASGSYIHSCTEKCLFADARYTRVDQCRYSCFNELCLSSSEETLKYFSDHDFSFHHRPKIVADSLDKAHIATGLTSGGTLHLDSSGKLTVTIDVTHINEQGDAVYENCMKQCARYEGCNDTQSGTRCAKECSMAVTYKAYDVFNQIGSDSDICPDIVTDDPEVQQWMKNADLPVCSDTGMCPVNYTRLEKGPAAERLSVKTDSLASAPQASAHTEAVPAAAATAVGPLLALRSAVSTVASGIASGASLRSGVHMIVAGVAGIRTGEASSESHGVAKRVGEIAFGTLLVGSSLYLCGPVAVPIAAALEVGVQVKKHGFQACVTKATEIFSSVVAFAMRAS